MEMTVRAWMVTPRWQAASTRSGHRVSDVTHGATELAVAAIDPIVNAVGKEAEKAVDAFWEREKSRRLAMQQFRDALTSLAATVDGQTQKEVGKSKKLVFIVDELDRCRPDYALNLLEIIKHFFSVPNVHFVLGVNLLALEQSVKARYGAVIDASQYLQKFIHLKISLPEAPILVQGQTTSLKYFGAISNEIGLSCELQRLITDFLSSISLRQKVSLRDVQRISSQAALLPTGFDGWPIGIVYLVLGALFMKVLSPSHYRKLRADKLTFDDALQFFDIAAQPGAGENRWGTFNRNYWACALKPFPHVEVTNATCADFGLLPTNVRALLDTSVTDCLETFTVPKASA